MSSLLAATQEAAHGIFDDQHASWREVISGLDAEALNWKPGNETNSITVLVSHSMDAERFLMASAVGVELDRDREAKFRVVASGADELLQLVDDTAREVRGYIDAMTEDLLTADHARPGRTHSGEWWFLHAVEHSREHIGQALLTRQLYEQQR